MYRNSVVTNTQNTMNNKNISALWQYMDGKSWRDWRWQMANRIRSVEYLNRLFPDVDEDPEDLDKAVRNFRMSITPFFAALLAEEKPGGVLWKQAIPSAEELREHPELSCDPLSEERDSPIPNLVHRYKDRVLLLTTDRCALYCRHCNRRRRAKNHERDTSAANIAQCIEYIAAHPEIREVILSGGDPLTLTDRKLDDLLTAIKEISSVEIIRICTRMPVVLPYRITRDLCDILEKHHPLFVNIHVNHPAEMTDEMYEACGRLSKCGVPLGSQTVLLKGINDEPEVLQALLRKLLRFRIKPYSLYHGDPVSGTAHFRTTIRKGRLLMRYIAANTSGMALPHYAADAPDGAGKILLLGDHIGELEGDKVTLINSHGMRVQYPDGEDDQ